MRIPTNRKPTHPGEMLLEEFLKPMGITQRELANALGISYQRVNEIVNQRRGISSSTALRLARYFNMSAEFWLNAQMCWDLYHTLQVEAEEIEAVPVYAMVA